MPRYH